MLFIKIFIKILILFAVLILFLMQDDLGNDEYSKFKKTKDKAGMICYTIIILGFTILFFMK